MNPDVPFYLDWNFWTALAAVVALILSQLPPLHLFFRRSRVELEVHSRFHLSHKVGNPNAQLHLILTNLGARSVRIREIRVTMRRDRKEIATLPAQSYLQNPGDTATVLFTSFALKPMDEWGHIVNFLNYFSRVDEKRYRAAESALRAAITDLRKLPENEDRIVEVPANLAAPFLEMFNEKFVWHPGEYEMLVTVVLSDLQIERKYRFTLFESDAADLAKVTDDYRTGDGINWDSGKHAGVIVPLSEA